MFSFALWLIQLLNLFYHRYCLSVNPLFYFYRFLICVSVL
nr:MAG TPA: hypothetical protein [Caudoviricetes sp.]